MIDKREIFYRIFSQKYFKRHGECIYDVSLLLIFTESIERYADDFMLLSHDKNELTNRLGAIDNFLGNNLLLKLHPNKVHMRKLTWGIDFVGYVAKPYYNLPRKKTVRRIIGRIKSISNYNEARLASYLGYLKHSHSKKKQKLIKEIASLDS